MARADIDGRLCLSIGTSSPSSDRCLQVFREGVFNHRGGFLWFNCGRCRQMCRDVISTQGYVEITSRHSFLKKNEKRHPIYPTPVKNTENLEKKIKSFFRGPWTFSFFGGNGNQLPSIADMLAPFILLQKNVRR